MINRRSFLDRVAGLAATSLLSPVATSAFPVAGTVRFLATWNHGLPANRTAMDTLANGGSILDAVQQGVMVVEADPTNLSVGLGGLPDRDGIVTLDACLMDGTGRCGSVSFVQGIAHPVALARAVMDHTQHVMLVGAGAEQFAREQGMNVARNSLSEAARKAWEEWKKSRNERQIINRENHDTIGLIGLDVTGALAGACTTSGLAWKRHGRVGDSPIIGAGLFVDNEVGAATCTGLGEAVLRTCASMVAVERMRAGASPQEACQEAIARIVRKNEGSREFQVGILAMNRTGERGAFALQPGFTFADGMDLLSSSSRY
jgi:N4-(beta-N-acetylglucosaminyl)-L-asparaginase